MGILSGLLGGGVGSAVEGVAKAVDTFIETPDEKAAQRLKEQALLMKPYLAQLKVNEQEAAHTSIFVAGWRPAVGWVCAAAFAYAYVVSPLLNYALAV